MEIQNANRIVAFNLSRIRKRLKMTQQELAGKLGISRQAIFKYEQGLMKPDYQVILKFKEHLNIDPNEIFETDISDDMMMKDLEIKDVSYREGDGIDEDAENHIKKQTIEELQRLIQLEKWVGHSIKFKNPIEDIKVKTKKDAHRAAQEVRKRWNLYDNPIANVISLLERKGIKVIEINENDIFHGLSAWFAGKPIIVLNYNVTEVTRKRFTALHELGHLILQFEDDLTPEVIEKICDAFSSMMLLPRELMIYEIGGKQKSLKSDDIIKLKEKYGISFKAIVVSAYNYDIISKQEYLRLLESTEPKGEYPIREKSEMFEHLIRIGLEENKIDERRADDFRKAKFKELIHMEPE